MREKYEQLHILLIIAWLVTRKTEGFLIIFPFLGVMFLVAHIIVTQLYYQAHELEKKQRVKSTYLWLRVFHYTTLFFIYVFISFHFFWRLSHVI